MSDVQEFFRKRVVPLVGHRKPSNDGKRYTSRPLVVVYYGVDFSFDYRKGESGPAVSLSKALNPQILDLRSVQVSLGRRIQTPNLSSTTEPGA